jgi:DNA-binding NarL/FixJ family response regulator
MKKIVIVEDNEDLLKPLVALIESTQKYTVVKTYSKAEDALKDIKNNLPELVIMDIKLDGKMDGVECTAALKKAYPNIDVLIFTVFEDSGQVFEALKAGACGYLTKSTNISEIVAALDQLVAGGAPMSFKIARMVLGTFNKNSNTPFTEKEDAVLNMLAKGSSYKSAAVQLEVSIETVKYHIKNIYLKLQVNNKEDAIELARKNNWI